MQLVTMGNDESELGSLGNIEPFKPKGALFFNIVLHFFICGLRTIPHWLATCSIYNITPCGIKWCTFGGILSIFCVLLILMIYHILFSPSHP